MVDPLDRLPYHERALALFIAGYPTDTAELVACSELHEQQQLRRDLDERLLRPPRERMGGTERKG